MRLAQGLAQLASLATWRVVAPSDFSVASRLVKVGPGGMASS